MFLLIGIVSYVGVILTTPDSTPKPQDLNAIECVEIVYENQLYKSCNK